MIYLDNAATTKPYDEVVDIMNLYSKDLYWNPGALYHAGRSVADAVWKSRRLVAELFGTSPERVIFTSGGSEGNSLVFGGLRKWLATTGKKHVAVSAIEHDSVLNAAKALALDGFDVTYIYPDSDGRIAPEAVEKEIRPDTGLVSVMFANNETGVINDVKEIGRICRKHSALFHTDCVQAAGEADLCVEDYSDFATISAHKIHGPKGVGALYARQPVFLDPSIHGGSRQEQGLRGGTENVPGIMGFGIACELSARDMETNTSHTRKLKTKFYNVLLGRLDETFYDGFGRKAIHINGDRERSLSKILNLRIDGIDNESLLLMLDSHGVFASAGSACNSHEAVPSHVLTAMGLAEGGARSSVRFSFSEMNTMEEVKEAARICAGCIDALLPI